MAKEKTVTLRPFDRNVAQDVYSILFYTSEYAREDGLFEIPSASYQLVVSALELIAWDVGGEDKEIIKRARGICEFLRDKQKMREWDRKDKEG